MTTQDRRAAEEIARKFGDYEWGYSGAVAANIRAHCADAIFAALQKAREEERERCLKALDAEGDDLTKGQYHWSTMACLDRLEKRIRALPESEGQ